MRPLYHSSVLPERLPEGGHAGLWFDKFCNRWPQGWEKLGTQKREWIETVVGSRGNPALLDEAIGRMARLLEAHGQSPRFYRTAAPFVTGLGREHPVENGFVWHQTLGTPLSTGLLGQGYGAGLGRRLGRGSR